MIRSCSCRLASFLVMAVSGLALTASAQAATVFTSLASFATNTQPGLYTNTFTGTTGATTLPFSNGVFSYVISSTTVVYATGDVVGADATTDDITISFNSGNVTAVGGNFFQTDISSTFQADPITINLSDGTSVTTTPATINDYLGFASTIPITSLTLKSLGQEGRYITLDNLSVGAAATNVPEGNSLFLGVLAGLPLGVILVRRRNQCYPNGKALS